MDFLYLCSSNENEEVAGNCRAVAGDRLRVWSAGAVGYAESSVCGFSGEEAVWGADL